MWRFTQNRIVIRKDISTVVKVPAEEVKEILEQMARLKINKGWEFVFEYDQEFVNRHPEVVQRQLMLWDAKFQQLSKTLKISKADMERKAKSDELAAACSSPEKPKRRRTISRSRTKSTSAGSGMSDLSDNEVESSAKERSRRPSGQSRSRRNSGGWNVNFAFTVIVDIGYCTVDPHFYGHIMQPHFYNQFRGVLYTNTILML